MKYESSVWIRVLSDLFTNNEKTIASICKNLVGTYGHIHKIVTVLEKSKMVTTRKIGRKVMVKLTSKGEGLAEACKKVGDFVEQEKRREEMRSRMD